MNHTVPPTQKSPSAIVMPCIPNSLVTGIKKLLCKAGENRISQVAKCHSPQLWSNTDISDIDTVIIVIENGWMQKVQLPLPWPRISGMSFNIFVTPHAYM